MWDRIEELMAAKGVKTADMHKATGIPYSSFTDWKKANRVPKLEKLQQIADYLGVTVDYLRTGDVQTLVPSSEYSEDVQKMLTTISGRPDIKQFIEAAADAAPEDVLAALDVLLALKRKGKE